MEIKIWKNLEMKVVSLLSIVVVLLAISIYIFTSNQYFKVVINELKDDAGHISSYITETVDERCFFDLNTEEDMGTEIFLTTYELLNSIGRITNIPNLYLAKRNDNGEFVYVVDDSGDDRVYRAGEIVDAEIAAYLKQCLDGEAVYGDRIIKTERGVIYLAYLPFRDSTGNVIGVIGMEFDTEPQYNYARWSGMITIIDSLIIAAIFITITFFSMKKIVNTTENAFIRLEKEKAEAEERATEIYYDALTKIRSRRYLDEELDKMIKSLSRSSSAIAVMMVDVDCFKKYNDAYGHTAGDNCLKIVAESLSSGLDRDTDFVARYGGEEFALVLPHTDEHGARMVADRLLENIRRMNIRHETSDVASCVTYSIGVVAGVAKNTQCGEDYIKKADEMLYISKQDGRNRYTFTHMR